MHDGVSHNKDQSTALNIDSGMFCGRLHAPKSENLHVHFNFHLCLILAMCACENKINKLRRMLSTHL